MPTKQAKPEVDGPPLPEWQKRELDRRYKEYLENSTELYDWEEVHADLRGRMQRNRAAEETRQ